MNSIFGALFVIIYLVSGAAMAQQDRSTMPSKTAENTTSLTAAMKFVQDSLNAVGRVTYTVHGHDSTNGHDWTNAFSNETSRVTANPTTCRINYHFKSIRDGNVTMDANAGFLLKDVLNIDVLTRQKYFDEANLLNGHPSWVANVEPPVFVVRIRRTANVENQFVFFDEVTATRVAKALTHAVELCANTK